VIKNGRNAVSSVYELAFNLINKNYTQIDKQTKIKIINKIIEVLQNGSSYNSINSKIQTSPIGSEDVERYLESTRVGCSNLINFNTFYYHNELRVVPSAPEVYFDLNTGDFVREPFEYFLEMKASYTIDDLINYLRTKPSMSLLFNNENRLVGGLNSLLGKYDIDKLLFAIDHIDMVYDRRFLKNIFEVEEYIKEAEDSYNMKLTESVVNGTNKIVPKKRELFKEKSGM
jgi:hypothetical protein